MGIESVTEAKRTWESKKSDLLKNINMTLEEGRCIDPEVLEIMREMLETVKVKVNMKDYFDKGV